MNRIGFHYFPDTQHYRQPDLDIWLPELQALNAQWLVLIAPPERAIPEHFIQELISAKIEPILHFKFAPDQIPPYETLQLLFEVYAKWGVNYITLFDFPNLRTTWKTANWAQSDLVERFLDRFIPLAELCIQMGLTPIFPPLKPGGDYWDTAFLPAALAGIQRRGHQHLLDRLVIGALSWTGNRPLNWGAGGPERWPATRPYFTPPGEEDHQGFRIFDWYNALVESVLVKSRPIFLFGLGCALIDDTQLENHSNQNLMIARLLTGEPVSGIEPLPANVIGGAFWLLSASPGDPQAHMAWIPPGGSLSGETKPIVQALKSQLGVPDNPTGTPKSVQYPIQHYVLLPTFEDAISDYHFDLIRPLVKKYKSTLGFSITDASRAQRVTIVGNIENHSMTAIRELVAKGCIVERIDDNGTLIAPL